MGERRHGFGNIPYQFMKDACLRSLRDELCLQGKQTAMKEQAGLCVVLTVTKRRRQCIAGTATSSGAEGVGLPVPGVVYLRLAVEGVAAVGGCSDTLAECQEQSFRRLRQVCRPIGEETTAPARLFSCSLAPGKRTPTHGLPACTATQTCFLCVQAD